MAGTAPVTIVKMSPADRGAWRNVLEKTILSDGVKILMADKECGITYHRTQAKAERKAVTRSSKKGRRPDPRSAATITQSTVCAVFSLNQRLPRPPGS